MLHKTPTTTVQNVARCLLGTFMVGAGTGHLTFARRPFQAQVPDWVPLTKDAVVWQSGVVEIGLGLALIFTPRRYRAGLGVGLAAFYLAVFPGNIHQYLDRLPALGLDTDTKRYGRLFLQPVLVGVALWSAGVFNKNRK
ncbi:MAG: DoxX family protein [Janthinobacterium lividum]